MLSYVKFDCKLNLKTQLTYIFPLPLLNRSFENLDRLVKKIKLKYQGSPVENPKQLVAHNVKKGKRLLFHEDNREQPFDEISQKKMVATTGGEDLPDRDLTDNEWCMQYIDSKKKVVLYTAKKKGDGQLDKEKPFMYGRILRPHYEDHDDSLNLIVMVDFLEGSP